MICAHQSRSWITARLRKQFHRALRTVGLPLLLVCPLAAADASVAFEYRTISDWGQGFQGQVTIANHTTLPIQNWRVEFDSTSQIGSMWDATVLSHTGARYVVANAGWNSDLRPGATVSFGFVGAPGGSPASPTNFRIYSANPPPPSVPPQLAPVTVTIIETSRWQGGFSGSMLVQNTGTAALNGWTLRLSMDVSLDSFWNANLSKAAGLFVITGADATLTIPAGGVVLLGFTGTGELTSSTVTSCVMDNAACTLSVQLLSIPDDSEPQEPAGITLSGVDQDSAAQQFAIGLENKSIPLTGPVSQPSYKVSTNNPAVVRVSVEDGNRLKVEGLAPGRAGLRIVESVSGMIRFVGVRVHGNGGATPVFPNRIAVGSVSEDSDSHLSFWRGFGSGALNRYSDMRYIYLNGGPVDGWSTWGDQPGSRLVNYIRNSRQLGIMPAFVFYNIPGSSEGYQIVADHLKDAAYLRKWFENLNLALGLINRESPDDGVVMVLEPDSIGYLAQNSGLRPAAIPVATHVAYDAGILKASDPQFPDTLTGFVSAVNYLISHTAPQVSFGWQLNLWASPAGGWTTVIPSRGIVHLSDALGVEKGKVAIAAEAAAIAQYYREAGIGTNGASFVAIDKYGLDAGAEAGAARNPAASTWFWNGDLWNNYLLFASSVHTTLALPIVLWQMPVGHINSTQATSPYSKDGAFVDLPNTPQRYEDSAADFFFGDTLVTSATRAEYFSKNDWKDPAVRSNGQEVTWGDHMGAAQKAGIAAILFGAGVEASTSNVGAPPSDDYWWMTKAVRFLVPAADSGSVKGEPK